MKPFGGFAQRPYTSSSFLPGRPLTSNLLLQVEYNVYSLLQYAQFGLLFLIAQMELTHAAELLKRLVDVPHAEALAGVVGHPPHFLPLSFDLHWQIFIVIIVIQTGEEPMADEEGRRQQYGHSSMEMT